MISRWTGAALAWGYGAIGTLGLLLASPVLAWFALHPGRKGEAWRERLGRIPRGVPRGAVWLHAASVGEVTALGPLLRALRRLRRPPRVVLSVMTEAGRDRARALYREPSVLAPLDVPPCARWWAFAAAPRALLVMETELWPARVAAAAAVAPVAWVNGRLSDRSYPWYRIAAPLVGRLFGRMRWVGVIGHEDARRAVALGAPPRRVRVCGNLKADLLAPARAPRGIARGLWLVAGSTRPGEEAAVLDAYRAVRARVPRARLCLAPRHLARAGEVAALASDAGWSVARRSDPSTSSGSGTGADVLVLDTHGELASFYRLAAAAFVGGTLARVGGHNLLEPALVGVPVCFGPHTGNVREEAAGLLARGGGFRVASGEALGAVWAGLLRSPRRARAAGARARAFVRSRQGVAPRVARLLRREGLV